jgi:hypothetical protein
MMMAISVRASTCVWSESPCRTQPLQALLFWSPKTRSQMASGFIEFGARAVKPDHGIKERSSPPLAMSEVIECL